MTSPRTCPSPSSIRFRSNQRTLIRRLLVQRFDDHRPHAGQAPAGCSIQQMDNRINQSPLLQQPIYILRESLLSGLLGKSSPFSPPFVKICRNRIQHNGITGTIPDASHPTVQPELSIHNPPPHLIFPPHALSASHRRDQYRNRFTTSKPQTVSFPAHGQTFVTPGQSPIRHKHPMMTYIAFKITL